MKQYVSKLRLVDLCIFVNGPKVILKAAIASSYIIFFQLSIDKTYKVVHSFKLNYIFFLKYPSYFFKETKS